MVSSSYDEAALSERTCREWFQRFKSGDFDVENRHGGGKVKIFENFELEALLAEYSCQTQEELIESLGVSQKVISKHLKAVGMIQKQVNWVPYEVKLRDVKCPGEKSFGERPHFVATREHSKTLLTHYPHLRFLSRLFHTRHEDNGTRGQQRLRCGTTDYREVVNTGRHDDLRSAIY